MGGVPYLTVNAILLERLLRNFQTMLLHIYLILRELTEFNIL